MITELKDDFDYEFLDSQFTEEEIKKNFRSLNKNFSTLTKKWDISLNTEWILRNYLAIKMILSSSVLISSAEFAKTKNLKIVEPYLIYYSLFNCSRAVLLTSPIKEWENGKLFELSHKATIEDIAKIVIGYNKEKGEALEKYINWMKEYRELFSYKFPARGLTNSFTSLQECVKTCKLLCEIAQFQSKVLENSITKHVKDELDLDWNALSDGFTYGEINFQFIDQNDASRLGYAQRKQKRPYSIFSTMTEGMVEDFFGAWCPDDQTKTEDLYNPDTNWLIIFPVP